MVWTMTGTAFVRTRAARTSIALALWFTGVVFALAATIVVGIALGTVVTGAW